MRRRLHFSLLALALALSASGVARAADDPARPRQWALDRIGAEAAWAVGDGSGVTVAVVDSGVDLHHEELVGKLVPGHDFVDDDDLPQDANGHGTHVAGIIAAATGNGHGIAGVAPGAKIMPVRVLGPDGSGTVENVIAGIHWAVAHGAKVVNLSLGDDTQAVLGPPFAAALRQAWAAGVVPVVAAGNQFITGSGFSDEPALVVAATNRNDAKPSYSSGVGAARWGLAAPGGELPDLGTDGAILSTYWNGKAPNQYAFMAGTSQAAPQVSGAVADLLSTGRFDPSQAVQRLLDTAKDIGLPGRDPTFGAGRLDLAAATKGLEPAPPGHRATGTPSLSPPKQPATTVSASSIPLSAASPTTAPPGASNVDITPAEKSVRSGKLLPATGRASLKAASSHGDESRTTVAGVAALLLLLVGGALVQARRRHDPTAANARSSAGR